MAGQGYTRQECVDIASDYAAGQAIPPYLVFLRQRMRNELLAAAATSILNYTNTND